MYFSIDFILSLFLIISECWDVFSKGSFTCYSFLKALSGLVKNLKVLLNVVLLSFRADGIGNYQALLHTGMPIGRMLFNSVLVSFLQVIVIVAVSSLAAFSFSKLHFRGKTLLYTLVMLTMSIPMISLMTVT